MSCISFEQPSVSVSSLFLICSLFFSCSNDGCIWMWYTWLPRASIPQYYSVPTGRRLINDHALRPQAQYVLMIVIPTCDIWPSYPQQPTGEDGSAASLLEVGVWAIIAKVLATDWNSGAHNYLSIFSGEGGGVLLGDGDCHWRAASIFHGKGCKALRCVLLNWTTCRHTYPNPA